MWERRFGGDRGLIGRSITLDGSPHIVIGIMPEGFAFPTRAEVWTSLGAQSDSPGWSNRGNHPGIFAVGRLADGVDLDAARAEMTSIAALLGEQHPDTNAHTAVLG